MLFLHVQFGGRFHGGEPLQGYTRPLVEPVREVARHQQDRQPDDVDGVVCDDRKAEQFARRAEHLFRRRHVRRAADPASGQCAEAHPGIVRQPAMDDHVRDDAAHHDTGRSHQHDQHAFAHDTDHGRDVDLDQHQHDECRQRERTQAAVDNGLVGNDGSAADVHIAQDDRRDIDEQQRRQVLEQFRPRRLFEVEEEAGDGTQNCQHADRRGNQGCCLMHARRVRRQQGARV